MPKKTFLLAIPVVIATAGIYLYFNYGRNARTVEVINWFRDPASRPELMMTIGTECNSAPFIFPTNGLIGFIWDDSFRPAHRHSGVDIFAGTEVGVTPIVALLSVYRKTRFNPLVKFGCTILTWQDLVEIRLFRQNFHLAQKKCL
jgi:membrane-associated phospholipid phosphatase